jgi:hypothetical protein
MTQTMTRPWADIEATYRGRSEVAPMLRLVEQVRASAYEPTLHAWTSLHDLCIVQAPCAYPYDGPYLRISPRFDGTIDFRYIDTPIGNKQWHRVVNEDDAFARFERFMEQLHWIPGRISA